MAAPNLFADRMFFTINGFEAVWLESGTVRRTMNLKRVDTMTRSRRSAGFQYGNMHIQIQARFKIEAQKAQIDMALTTGAEVNLVAECGGERYIAKQCAESDMEMSGQVGDASKTMNLEAIDLTNENGSPVNSVISLG